MLYESYEPAFQQPSLLISSKKSRKPLGYGSG